MKLGAKYIPVSFPLNKLNTVNNTNKKSPISHVGDSWIPGMNRESPLSKENSKLSRGIYIISLKVNRGKLSTIYGKDAGYLRFYA